MEDTASSRARKVLAMMVASRHFEELTDTSFKQHLMHGTTHLSMGQEGAQVALSMALQEGDMIVPTHRHHGHTLCRGADASAMFAEMFGSREGLCKGLGGSMHMSDVIHGNVGASAIVASGIPMALGLAFALKQEGKGRIAVAIFGDGATSRGTLHECMNMASIWQLPILFYCENNGYGMSASVSRMVSTDNIAERAEGYRMAWAKTDGNNVPVALDAVQEAVDSIRKSGYPFFLEVSTYRENGHSKSDKCVYRSREEEEAWKLKDPICTYVRYVVERGILSDKEVTEVVASAVKEIDQAYAKAEAEQNDVLTLDEAKQYIFAPESQFRSKHGELHQLSYREAVREALDEEMSRDRKVFLMGEDIGKYGGCFGVTGDLYKRHASQMWETPVSEESFTGLAVGAAMKGMRPVVEIMYGDFCTLASDPLVNHAAKTSFMSAGQLSCPMVLRTPMGSGTGHGSQHTQSLEAMFASIPGLIVVCPSTAHDAKALLKSAIRSNNPVLFCEQKMLYGVVDDVDGPDYVMPLGKADVKREGNDCTVVCYGRAVQTALQASVGLSVEVVDLCTLRPLDMETVFASVRKTKRLVVVEEADEVGGYGSEVISRVCCAAMPLLSPPVLLGGLDMPVPFAASLEEAMVPSVEGVRAALVKVIGS